MHDAGAAPAGGPVHREGTGVVHVAAEDHGARVVGEAVEESFERDGVRPPLLDVVELRTGGAASGYPGQVLLVGQLLGQGFDLSLAKTLTYAAEQGRDGLFLRSRLALDGFQARALTGARLADPHGGVIRGADWKDYLRRRFRNPRSQAARRS